MEVTWEVRGLGPGTRFMEGWPAAVRELRSFVQAPLSGIEGSRGSAAQGESEEDDQAHTK